MPSTSSLSTWLARALAPLVPLVSLAACADDSGQGNIIDPLPPSPAVDEAALRSSLAAWAPQLRKGCSLDDVFGAAKDWQPHTKPDEREIDLDTTQLVAKLGGKLWVRAASG